jgi:hypothetical protein
MDLSDDGLGAVVVDLVVDDDDNDEDGVILLSHVSVRHSVDWFVLWLLLLLILMIQSDPHPCPS